MARDLRASETSNRIKLETNSWFSTGKRAAVGKLWLGCLFIVWVAVLLPSPGFAKPKLDEDGVNCLIPAKCGLKRMDSTCAMLYCGALRANCKGDYSSGECKNIKDEHKKNDCSEASEECGKTLPRIITIGDVMVDILSGEVFVVVDPEDDAVDFSAIFDAAAASAALLDPKTCLDRCLSKVSKECAPACREICGPEQY